MSVAVYLALSGFGGLIAGCGFSLWRWGNRESGLAAMIAGTTIVLVCAYFRLL